ncbi:hypothetical protein FB45DRAFT_840713 [Roridomyces roridus]|uniref:Asl1-like glycosyl hydrolase catalytic domain-containing protein n=1 Tax=Roridomyces roridus TaxID=1738132 RepID=A0AAD7BDP1_9AGAR|nr:hypothetical protein FB45DRAFT_840713 [Roridomyces roridus]
MKCFTALSVLVTLACSAYATPVESRNATVEARNGPGKRGLAWPWYNGSLNPAKMNINPGTVNLIYDWETYAVPSTNGNGGLNYIGMQRCTDCSSSPIGSLAARQQQLGFSTVFTLNEPDINGISPSSAASWYIQWVNPLAIKKALPAVTSSTNAGQGLDWVAQFISACGGQCFYDYINIHWYGNSFGDFQNFVNSAHSRFPNNQLVITEFALQGGASQAAQISFFKQAISFLDGASFVNMYFPFVATSPALFQANDPAGAASIGTGSCLYNNDGSVSAVGQLFYQ